VAAPEVSMNTTTKMIESRQRSVTSTHHRAVRF
jgi:hypothetical protein